ncbi:copper amine oxidase N-terminal domain-containing protein [Paenibacillus sp. GCM10027626]|uniref:copper amine oxidase N-terminal domain-containing protein n=1 Tax=Paenibacillus sp. GCM10027626 TaxID=3273411 RepID=UPI00364364C3
MKKVLATIVASVMLFSMLLLPPASAASAIKIVIDGETLATDQPPVAINGSVFVPLRGIFEALDAVVYWNQKAQTVKAVKGNVTIVLKIGAKTATINDETVALDAYARAINGRTMVPIRFVSESLGEKVEWSKKLNSVLITTFKQREVGAAQYVNVIADYQYGDGRDWRVMFAPPSNQDNVKEYRILAVKENAAASFNLAKAQSVSSANYTTVQPYTAGKITTMGAYARDVDGATLRADQSYRVFVLTVGADSYALSQPSAVVRQADSTNSATNVVISDVSDYGDGRDLAVSFTKAANDSNISNYRVMIVKTKDAGKFDLNAANDVSSSYYNTVYKSSSSTLSTQFSSSSRDVNGDWIKNGVPYTAFVLAVTNSSSTANRLSSGSASVTLGNYSQMAPLVTGIADVNNYGDGRDLFVSFNKVQDETNVAYYRLFVVREADYSKFSVSDANKLSSDRYTQVSKNGSNQSLTFTSSAKDVNGNYISNGVGYRVFVMAVASNSSSYPNLLSAPSSQITLSVGGANTPKITSVYDVNDYGNGQDLQVSFNRSADEGSVNHYRIFVVKSSNADSFKLSNANAIGSSNYTKVNKTGSNITTTLSSSASDVNGSTIRNGVSYRVFVMAVSNTGQNNNNLLSDYSNEITLSDNTGRAVATNVQAADVSDYNDGRDMLVTFTRAADESQINHYRIFVVKSSNASSFKVSNANAIDNPNNYMVVYKKGENISTTLTQYTRDVNGSLIKNDERYKVFVLSVRDGGYYGSNVLSAPSSEITLKQSSAVSAPSNVKVALKGSKGDGSDLEVSFSRSSSESDILEYRIIVVPNHLAGSFGLAEATRALSYGYTTKVDKDGRTLTQRLTSSTLDSQGYTIGYSNNGAGGYRAFVLAIAKNSSLNALSAPSDVFYLSGTAAPEVQNVSASQVGQTMTVSVNFASSNDTGVAHYAVLLVPEPAYGLSESKATEYYKQGNYTEVQRSSRAALLTSGSVDVNGAPLTYNVTYRVYVLSVADGVKAAVNSLSSSTATVRLVES